MCKWPVRPQSPQCKSFFLKFYPSKSPGFGSKAVQRSVLCSRCTSWRQPGCKSWWCSRIKSFCRQQEAITFQVSSLLVRLPERYDIFKAKWMRKSFRPLSSGSSEIPRDHYRSLTGRRPEWRQLKWHLLAQSNKDAILQNAFSMHARGEHKFCLSLHWNACS